MKEELYDNRDGTAFLRPWEDADAAELYELAKDPKVGPAAGWPPHTSAQYSLGIIHDILSEPENCAVISRETGKIIGCTGLMVGEASHLKLSGREAEIGYWLGVPYWGQGYMSEAVRGIIEYSFGTLGLQKLWCVYYEGNERSWHVQKACGFQYQRTVDKVNCAMLGEVRTEHVTMLCPAS